MTVEERANRAYQVRPIGCGNADYEAMIGWLKEILWDQIEDCAKIAKRYEDEEAEAARMFGRNQQPIPRATHAVMSVICGRIKDEIRALATLTEKGEEIHEHS